MFRCFGGGGHGRCLTSGPREHMWNSAYPTGAAVGASPFTAERSPGSGQGRGEPVHGQNTFIQNRPSIEMVPRRLVRCALQTADGAEALQSIQVGCTPSLRPVLSLFPSPYVSLSLFRVLYPSIVLSLPRRLFLSLSLSLSLFCRNAVRTAVIRIRY